METTTKTKSATKTVVAVTVGLLVVGLAAAMFFYFSSYKKDKGSTETKTVATKQVQQNAQSSEKVLLTDAYLDWAKQNPIVANPGIETNNFDQLVIDDFMLGEWIIDFEGYLGDLEGLLERLKEGGFVGGDGGSWTATFSDGQSTWTATIWWGSGSSGDNREFGIEMKKKPDIPDEHTGNGNTPGGNTNTGDSNSNSAIIHYGIPVEEMIQEDIFNSIKTQMNTQDLGDGEYFGLRYSPVTPDDGSTGIERLSYEYETKNGVVVDLQFTDKTMLE